MTFRFYGALSIVVALGATFMPVPSSGAPREPWTKVSRSCQVDDRRIDEASGISRSTYHRSLVFLHNDSGDGPRFFAVGRHCQTRAVFRVRHAPSNDWEDMAAGPNHNLWIGDIGDNATRRDYISVIRVREPRALKSGTVRGKVFRFRYPDGRHNAETLLVRPLSGRVYVVTKASSGAGIYRAPKNLSGSKVNVLTRIASVPFLATGGDFAPNGRHFILRSYSDAYLYKEFGGRATKVALPKRQPGGEAIGFTRGGHAVKVVSEGVDPYIYRVAR